MKIQLIADSCCDTTPAMRKSLGLELVPLKITVEGREFVDDETLSVKELLAAMKASKKPISTAAPSPEDYAALMRCSEASVVVTLSSKLSGSYNAAMAGRNIVLEETPDKKVMVFDSKSAASGELRIVMRICELMDQGQDFDAICGQIPAYIDGMRTFFVLEDLSNLVKNGRIPKLSGMLGTVLMLRPIMGENGEGEIIPLEKVRGTAKALARLVDLVAERTLKALPKSLLMTMSYCNNAQRAGELKKQFLAKCPALSDVLLSPTGGLSTSYANDGGIIIALA